MDTVQLRRILIAVIFFFNFGYSLKRRQDNQYCLALYREPYFDIPKVLGVWKSYYTWNVGYVITECVEMTVQNTTSAVIKRIRHDMTDYVEEQPNWDTASLYITMKTGHHDILLIPEPGAPGTFIGVPNVIKDPDNSPSKHTVPTFKFFIKLVEEGRYLLMIDCKASAVASLSAKEIPKKKDDLEFVVSKLPLGIGNFSCAFI